MNKLVIDVSKKISIVLVALLCLSMLPWTSIGVGSEAKNVKTAEPLKVDAWIESKLAKPGDTIEIYANTSYTEGVSVSADIMKYEHNEDAISSLSLENLDLSGMIYTTYVSTVSLTYNSTEKHWVGTYTIPSSAGGVYVADVTATDGTNTARDNTTAHLYKFYDKWIKPVQDKAETFIYGEFNDTVNDIKENLIALNDTINASGGIKGIVENLTGLPEWEALLDESYDPIYDDYEHYYSEYFSESFSDSALFEYNITVPDWVDVLELSGYCYSVDDWEAEVNATVTLTDPDGNVYTYDLNDYGAYMISSPTPGDCAINVATSGNGYFSLSIDGYLGEKSRIANFLDKLTKFILSDEYENIKSMIPELKSFIFGIPKENTIDYLLGFDLTHYLNKIEGAEGIVAAYNALMDSDEYTDFQDALDALQASETNWNQENLSIAIMDLFMSDETMNLFNATAEYLQGNDTALQNLINSFAAVDDFNSQLENLMELPEFDDLMGAVMNDINLSPVFESINTTFNNINNSVREMMNSTQFQNLNESIQNLQVYAESDYLYEWEYFTSDEAFDYNYTIKDWVKELYLDLDPYFDGDWDYKSDYFEADKTFQYNYTVKDWVKEIHLDLHPYFSGYYDYINETWVPGTGNITVTITDPNGVVYTYTEAYNGSEYYYYEYEKHDYTIENPAPGNWTIEIETSGGSGHYDLQIYAPGAGDITVTLTDPNGVVYAYTEAYNESAEEYKYGKHDYTILFPTPGNWTVNVATSGGDGNYNLNIGPKDDFMTYMLKELMEEIFFVFNAGIAIETNYFQTIGTDGSAKLIAYDANGRIANEEINVIVSRNTGGMLGATGIIPAAILYVWVSGFQSSGGMVSPVAALTASQYDDEYRVTIVSVSEVTNPDEVEWYLLDTQGSAQASGDMSALGYTSNDVTVTWNDNDGDGKLSTADTISIYKSGDALGGYKFRLMHVPTGSIMCEITLVASMRTAYDGEEYETESAGISSLFAALPYIKQMMEEIKPGIVYEGKVTTDSNGEATINFPVEKFGIYTIDAYFEDENRIGFGESGFIGESFVPEIGLTPIGKFAGIPVYMNPNKIGENITFDVTVPDGESASVAIAPLPLNELFPDINMSYESSDTTITGSGNVTLQVNGPLSLIGVITEMPIGEAEYEEYNEGYTSYPDTSFSIPQFNVSFGILLTSNVSVTLDVPNMLKGERSQLDVSATGMPVITYGVACYANGLDVMSLDVATLSTMAYEGAVYQKEYNLTDVMELMKSMICGPGNTAFVTIPKLAADGEYSFITFTNVDNTDIGAAFTSVNVYAETEEIPAVTSNETVDNKDVVVTYVGSGKVIIKKATVTPPAPPANVKHIGIFIEIDTTGTVHDAFITIKYNDSDVSDIDESKLRMYYWNDTISEWVIIEDSGVWTNNNTVWARINHFTIFAPMAEKTAAGPAPISWLIYVGVISAVIIILVISLAATVKRKKKILLPPNP